MTLPFVPSAEVLPKRPATLPGRRLFRDRVTLPLLLLLTILGGVLRFTALDRPSVWGDEAATYGRVAGTYDELLNQLADSAFPPLHYELEWWIGQGMPYWGHWELPDHTVAKTQFVPTAFLAECSARWIPWICYGLPLLTIVLVTSVLFSITRPRLGPQLAFVLGAVASLAVCETLLLLWNIGPIHSWASSGLPYWGYPQTDGSFVWTKFVVTGPVRLTPFALRFVPALAGTLFIPAIFFVAVQLFGRRVALIAAFIACFSAYALVYSRDAKMYMHLWLAVTLHVGFALWWVRTRRPTAWALWVLTGVAAVGLHASGFAALGLDVLIVFTSSKQNWQHLYTVFPIASWSATLMLGRVAGWARLNRNWWQRRDWQKVAVWQRRAVQRFRWPVVVGFAIGVAMMLAAAFGPLGYYSAFSQQVQRAADHADQRNAVDLNELGIGWATEYNEGRQLPDFLLYTTSAYLTGWEWPRHFPDKDPDKVIDDQSYMSDHTGTRMSINVRTLRLLQGATIGLLALLAVGLVPWRRAFSPARARLDRIMQDGRVNKGFYRRRALWLALWLTIVPWAFYTQSVVRVTNVLDGAAALVLNNTSVPTVDWPRATRHLDPSASLAAPDANASVSDKMDANWKVICAGYCEIVAALPAPWAVYTAAWTSQNVSVWKVTLLGIVGVASLATVIYARRRIGWRTLRLILVVGLLVTLTTVMAALPKWVDGIPWMPRYLGVVLPAVFIFVAVLIDRQPNALRWVTLGLFVAVNLSQFSARVWAGSEPPTGLMAADLIAGSPAKEKAGTPTASPKFRAYFQFGPFHMAEPGGGTLFTPAGCYYMRMLSGISGDLMDIRSSNFERNFQIWKYGIDRALPAVIEDNLKLSPQIDHFVTWTAMAAGEVDQNDGVADRLKGKYKRVNDELWQVRDHWRWVDRWQVRRRTYERISTPANPPARQE